jgi:hypothetical protein
MQACASLERCKSLIILELDINETKAIGLKIVDDLAFAYVGHVNGRVETVALASERTPGWC